MLSRDGFYCAALLFAGPAMYGAMSVMYDITSAVTCNRLTLSSQDMRNCTVLQHSLPWCSGYRPYFRISFSPSTPQYEVYDQGLEFTYKALDTYEVGTVHPCWVDMADGYLFMPSFCAETLNYSGLVCLGGCLVAFPCIVAQRAKTERAEKEAASQTVPAMEMLPEYAPRSVA